jgi:hypothetical protein
MIDEDQNKNKMVKAEKTDIILTIKAILYCRKQTWQKKRQSSGIRALLE